MRQASGKVLHLGLSKWVPSIVKRKPGGEHVGGSGE